MDKKRYEELFQHTDDNIQYIKMCIDNLVKIKNSHKEIAKEIIEVCGGLYDFHIYLLPIIKRSIDYLSAFENATEKYNINVQVPLLRLQVDNCILMQLAIMFKEDKNLSMEVLSGGFNLKKLKDPVSKTKLSETYIAGLISDEMKSLYKFCCEFVHFSKKHINATLSINNHEMHGYVKEGNKELAEDIVINSNSMIEVTKQLFLLIQELLNKIDGILLSSL